MSATGDVSSTDKDKPSKYEISSLSEFLDYITKITSVKDGSLSNELVESMQNSMNYDESEVEELDSFKVYRDYSKKLKRKTTFSEKDSSGRPVGRFFYRGQSNETFVPVPGIYRNGNLQLEDYFYHEIMVRCPDKFYGLNRLDRLVLMQHYGVPTRLLDITSNPLVALYFACKRYDGAASDKSKKGMVYIYFTNTSHVLYSESDKALMLSCLPQFSYEDKAEIYRIATEAIKDEGFAKKPGSSNQYKDKTVERFYHEISREIPSFKREIRPFDLLNPVIIQPQKSNTRILKQDGAFILMGLNENAKGKDKERKEAELKLRCITSQKVFISNRDVILRELDGIGIKEASLFPEMNNVADYLKWKVKN